MRVLPADWWSTAVFGYDVGASPKREAPGPGNETKSKAHKTHEGKGIETPTSRWMGEKTQNDVNPVRVRELLFHSLYTSGKRTSFVSWLQRNGQPNECLLTNTQSLARAFMYGIIRVDPDDVRTYIAEIADKREADDANQVITQFKVNLTFSR